MRYQLDDRGEAENQLCEAIAVLEEASRPLRRMALAPDGRGFAALSLVRASGALAQRANRLLSQDEAA